MEGILLKPEAYIKCTKEGDCIKYGDVELTAVEAEEKGLLFVQIATKKPATKKKTTKKTDGDKA